MIPSVCVCARVCVHVTANWGPKCPLSTSKIRKRGHFGSGGF